MKDLQDLLEYMSRPYVSIPFMLVIGIIGYEFGCLIGYGLEGIGL